jgi:glycosyltransferase AglI
MGNIKFTIIIPVYNNQKGLEDTLESLLNLSFSRSQIEIIVIDNNSSDKTLQIAQDYRDGHPDLIRIYSEETTQSSYASRNLGITNAKGDFCVFLDADESVDPDFLEKISDFIATHSAEYFGCKVMLFTGESENIFEKFNRLTGFPVEQYLIDRHFAPTCCLVTKKSVFDKVGLFNDNLESSGDYEFGNRTFNAGIKQHYAQNITIYHPARNSFSSLAQKAFRVGKGRSSVKKLGIGLYFCRGRRSSAPMRLPFIFWILSQGLKVIKLVGFIQGSLTNR